MSRVQIDSQSWGVVQDIAGNGIVGAAVQLKIAGTATSATHYSAVTAGTSSTADLLTDANGLVKFSGIRFVDLGAYDMTVSGVTRRVEAVSGTDVAVIKEVLYAKAEPYNVLGNNTDETTKLQTYFAALQGALGRPEGELGPGIFRTTAAITLGVFSLTLSGAGKGSNIGECTRLVNDVSNVFSISSDSGYLHFKDFAVEASAGHIFNQTADLSQSTFESLRLKQGSTSKSIWTADGTGVVYIDNVFRDCELEHVLLASVPGFMLRDTASNHNRNLWENLRCTNSGAFFFHIECSNAAAYAQNNAFREINFEVCNGGCIKALSTIGLTVENVGVYDLSATTTNDLFYVGASPTGAFRSVGAQFKNVWRAGGTIGGGLYDIHFQTGDKARHNKLEMVGRTSLSNFTVDLGGNEALILADEINTLDNVTASRMVRVPASMASFRVSALGVGNSAAATEVIGKAVTKKIEVFDHLGASLGFIPVYASIT